MPTNVPMYPAEGDVSRNVEEWADSEKRSVERYQRALQGLGPRDPLPPTPRDMPYPRMIFKPEYGGAKTPDEGRTFTLIVHNDQELSDAQREGFLPTLKEALERYKEQQERQKAEQERQKMEGERQKEAKPPEPLPPLERDESGKFKPR